MDTRNGAVGSALNNPTFVAYAIISLVLVANLLFLWVYSGAVRARTKTAVNPEDAALIAGAAVNGFDAPEVARVLRAHANAQALIYPFLVLGLLYVLEGGDARTGGVIFGAFALARWAHSAFYLAGRQPWRTIAFALSGVAILILFGLDVWLTGRGPG